MSRTNRKTYGKVMVVSAGLLGGLLLAPGGIPAASAAVVFSDNFDHVSPLGNFTDPFGVATAVSGLYGNPTTAMQIFGASSGVRYGARTLQSFGGNYELDFDAGQAAGRVYANFRLGGFVGATTDPANSARIHLVQNGTLLYQEYNFLSSGTETVTKSITLGTGYPVAGWNHWRIVANETNVFGTVGSLSFSVNPADVTVFGGNYFIGFGNLDGHNALGIDNVQVAIAPEPSLVMLLAVGGLWVAHRRRR